MSHSINESEEGILSRDQTDSPLLDDNNCGGSANGVILKKGPWTSAEDAILVDYVKKHGEGNWNAVQKHSGLYRCGKSCRLRWANHLRPNLKKGAFTTEEERLIIELHAKMGNKWARMAAHLPGRTDNEIKNYWNTRVKRRQRAGLPLYPPEVCLQALQENQHSQSACGIYGGDEGHHDLLQTNNYEIPDVVFDSLRTHQGVSPYVSELAENTGSNILMKGFGSSQFYSFIHPTYHSQKRHRESLAPLSDFNGDVGNEPPFFGQTGNDGCGNKISQSFDLSFPYDPDPMNKDLSPLSPFGVDQGSHSLLNGNFSASKPAYGAVKLELPSLQYSESDLGSWGSPKPGPLTESSDAFVHSPAPSVALQSVCLSPRNSGLLDALLYEAKTLSNAKLQSSEKSSNSSTITPGEIADGATLNIPSTEWEGYSDPMSLLGNSTASMFNECVPVGPTGSSLEENLSAESFPGCKVKIEPADQVWNMDGGKKETFLEVDVCRPDALLSSCWLEQSVACAKEQGAMTDAIASLLGEDHGSDLKNMAAGSSSVSQGWGFGSCSWNNMPAVCQMSEFP